MKCIIQRVSSASVTVDHQVIADINIGMLLLLGIETKDSLNDVQKIVKKIVELRIFPDSQGKFDRSLKEINGDILVVSQFTLMADVKKGRRPSFTAAAKPEVAKVMVEAVVSQLKQHTIGKVRTGQFGANMKVKLINDGPVTISLDSSTL